MVELDINYVFIIPCLRMSMEKPFAGWAFWQVSPWYNLRRVLFFCCCCSRSVAWPSWCTTLMFKYPVISLKHPLFFVKWLYFCQAFSDTCFRVLIIHYMVQNNNGPFKTWLISLFLAFVQNQGKDIADSELLDYISESSTMSKSLADYGQQKSCAVTSAKRLGDFLGADIVKHKGLRCQYIVACEPQVHFLLA